VCVYKCVWVGGCMCHACAYVSCRITHVLEGAERRPKVVSV